MCVLFAFSIVSLLFEIVYSNSVTATAVALVENCSFLKRHCPYLSFDFLKNVPIILRAGVILEIVKILGFGTVLFGIVQSISVPQKKHRKKIVEKERPVFDEG